MAPRNRAKLGLTIPVDPRCSGFEAFYGNTAIRSPSNSSVSTSPAPLPSPSRRNVPRSPRHQSSPRSHPSQRPVPAPPPAPMRRMQSAASARKSVTAEETEELESLVDSKSKKKLSRQLSMCETPRDAAWEKRRRQILRRERRWSSISGVADIASSQAADGRKLTDADWHELKGSIELGFGFNAEEGGQRLSNTLPALDLYFAVNRQAFPSPRSTSQASSPDGLQNDDSWKICSPGDNPQQVKTKLRHWAQAVACSVMQTL